jgi:hypothetical protein
MATRYVASTTPGQLAEVELTCDNPPCGRKEVTTREVVPPGWTQTLDIAGEVLTSIRPQNQTQQYCCDACVGEFFLARGGAKLLPAGEA